MTAAAPVLRTVNAAGKKIPTTEEELSGATRTQSFLLTLLGYFFIATSLPPVIIVIGSTVLWYYIDPITLRTLKFISRTIAPLWRNVMMNEKDTFMVNVFFLHGICTPLFFYLNLQDTIKTGQVSLLWLYIYHVTRIGPYFTNFAYAYVLCHKEGHTISGMFKKPYSFLLGNAYNWWVGFFYGVMPSTFVFGHSINHHRYNNDQDDVVSTWDRPRDSFRNYVRYVPRWLSYHFNISATFKFIDERKYDIAAKLVFGSVVYWCAFAYVFSINKLFAVAYLGYPLFESGLLLSAINWSWHCFLDPDTTNEYAYSVTVFGGDPERTNILNEDFHVVHHQYPARHWSEHPALYQKHAEEYKARMATCFDDTHAMEIFFLAILRKYDVLADKFHDLSGALTREQKVELITRRLRTCSWGPMQNNAK